MGINSDLVRIKDLMNTVIGGDPEEGHIDADELLIEAIECLARELGKDTYAAHIIESYKRVSKWYG